MNNHILNITATISGETISLDIQAKDEDYNEQIDCKIYPNNTFRFSYIHPENDKKNSYTGFIEKKKIWLYPQHGEATLTNNYIRAL